MASLNQWEEEKLDYLDQPDRSSLGICGRTPGSTETSYDRLCTALDQCFGAERLAAIHKAEMLSKKHIEGETLSALGQDMRRLVSCAYPDFPLAALE